MAQLKHRYLNQTGRADEVSAGRKPRDWRTQKRLLGHAALRRLASWHQNLQCLDTVAPASFLLRLKKRSHACLCPIDMTTTVQVRPFAGVRATPCRARRSFVVNGASLCGAHSGTMAPPTVRVAILPPPASPWQPSCCGVCAAATQRSEEPQRKAANMLLSLAASAALALSAGPATAEVRLPPLDNGGCVQRSRGKSTQYHMQKSHSSSGEIDASA